MAITKVEIERAINDATGNPSSGAIHDWTPAIARAIDELINGAPAPKEVRVVKASETPEDAKQGK